MAQMTAQELVALSYDDFVAYATEWIGKLPPTPYADRLPVKYFTGWRSWDVWQILKWADFKDTDMLLECGAWQTFACLFFAEFVLGVEATDNFYWEQRSFVREQNLPSSYEWQDTIMQLNIKHLKQGAVMSRYMDLQAIGNEDDTYDKITCISTIEHVLDDHKAMSEMVRVLKPGGRLLLTTEFDEVRAKAYSEADGSYYRVYNRQGWNELLAPYHVLHQEIDIWRGPHYFTTAFAVIEKGSA